MTLYRRKHPGTFVDPACPLDGSHLLNRDILDEWAVLPNSGWSQGGTFYDLVRGLRNPNPGTLTNGPTWAGSQGRPGSFGSVVGVAASTTYIDCGNITTINSLPQFTVAIWVRPTTLLSSRSPICKFSGSTGWTLESNFNGGITGFLFGFASGIYGYTDAALTAAGVWGHWCVVFDGTQATNPTKLRMYFNAANQTLDTTNGTYPTTMPNVSHAVRFFAGADGSRLYNGAVDECTIFSRALSATDVAALYTETQQGNPSRWRWIGTRSWSIPAAAPAGGGGRVIGPAGGVLGSGVLGSGVIA